jgi:hypothetical protein
MEPVAGSSTPSRSELKGFMEAMIQSNTHLVRTIVLVAVFFGMLCLGVLYIFRSFNRPGSNVKVSMLPSGLMIDVKNEEHAEEDYRAIQFLLPSSDVWFDTGIDLKPEETCEFKISGKVHLALHKLVESSYHDRPSVVHWRDANGNEFEKLGDTKEQDDAKRALLLYPGDEKVIGNVVCYLHPSAGGNSDFTAQFIRNRKAMTENILSIGTGGRERPIVNTTGKTVRIFLAVNDILFDFSDAARTAMSEAAYFGPRKEPAFEKTWTDTIQGKYEKLWYDDNMGSFLVSATIRKQKE